MRIRIVLLLLLFSAAAFRTCAAFQLAGQSEALGGANEGNESADHLWLIPHTHWEGAVFKTREEYLEEDLPNILEALHLLRTFPQYRFVLDQTAYVKPFLERYPEEAGEFRKLVAQGQLQIVGGNDVMLDVNIPSGESWIRQVLYGKGYYRQALGVDVTTGWALDTFGHHAQMPQLLKLAGYQSYWFQRGVRDSKVPSEFLWAGIDGSQIPAFWLPLSYGLFYPTPKNLFEFDRYTKDLWSSLGEYTHSANRVAMAGADVISPEEELPVMARAFDGQRDKPFTLSFGLPSEFEHVTARRTDRPVIAGELNPVFQGTYSSRIELKQWMREDERALSNAEKIGAVARVLGASPEEENRWREGRWQAWEPVLFNQAHDLTSGTMVDKVYQDSMQHYESSRELADGLLAQGMDEVAAKIDTRNEDGSAIPLLVFNPLGWIRTDVAEADVGFSEGGIRQVTLRTSSGIAEPVQLQDVSRYGDGGIRHAKVVFVAHDIRAMGWATYFVVPKREAADAKVSASDKAAGAANAAGGLSESTMHVDSSSIENEFYRASFDLWTGAMTGLQLKSAEGNWEVSTSRPGNIVACEQDGGDFWELYGNLNGARLTAMTRTQPLPAAGRSQFSNDWVGGSGKTTAGPVYSDFQIEHPFGNNRFETRVRLYRGIQRIDFETRIVNNDKSVRYRLLFPTSIRAGQRFDEIPFGAIERKGPQEFPAQNWFDYSDGKHGIALLNIGLPGSSVTDDTLSLSLMRSSRINNYGYVGGYEPGTSSDLGLELGQERVFQYALVPHWGDWRSAKVFRAGLEFNNPLLVRPLDQHPGREAKSWGFLDVSNTNVVMSALMPAEVGGDLILRVYEAAGHAAVAVKIHFTTPVASASQVNLMEDRGQPVVVAGNTIQFGMRPFEIKTFRLHLATIPLIR